MLHFRDCDAAAKELLRSSLPLSTASLQQGKAYCCELQRREAWAAVEVLFVFTTRRLLVQSRITKDENSHTYVTVLMHEMRLVYDMVGC